jgi:hypothetical protein
MPPRSVVTATPAFQQHSDGAAEAEFARLFGRSLSATNFATQQLPRLKVARAKPPRSADLRDEGVLALV